MKHPLQEIIDAITDTGAAAVYFNPLPPEQPEKQSSGLLTVKQAAAELNVSATVIRDACTDGRLKHTRFGRGKGTIRIASEDLANFKTDSVPRAKLHLRHLA